MNQAITKTVVAPVASVLMLAYNHGPYIRRAIESILRQVTSFPFELVIGEDCSTDNTREIALRFHRSHSAIVRVVTSDKNVGMHENLRRVEQACRGQYVAYCEGDDFWHVADKLQKQVEFLEARRDYAMVHSDCRLLFVETGQLIRNATTHCGDLTDDNAFNELLSGRRRIWTVTTCIRRSVLEEVLHGSPECYDPRFLMGDTQRWLEIARRGKIKYFSEALATRQALPESATRSKDATRVLRFALSAKAVLDWYIAKYGCPPEVQQAAMKRTAIHVLQSAFEAGDRQAAAAMLAECRERGVMVPMEGRLCSWGCQAKQFRSIIRVSLQVLERWENLTRRLKRAVAPV